MEPIEGELVNITWKVMDIDKHLKKIVKNLNLTLLSQLNKAGLEYSKTEVGLDYSKIEQQARLEKQSQNVKDVFWWKLLLLNDVSRVLQK